MEKAKVIQMDNVLYELDPSKAKLSTRTNNRWGREDKKDVRDLADEFLRDGQLEPIGFEWIDQDAGTYEVFYGNRRTAAAQFIVNSGANKQFKLQGIRKPELAGDDQRAFVASQFWLADAL